MTQPAPAIRPDAPANFIEEAIAADLDAGRFDHVCTRFPPEPNGYLHIGHAKAMLVNDTIARRHGGRFHFRFDDTNPAAEEAEYVEGIVEDARWLGVDWGDCLFFASDYFAQMVAWAEQLIEQGDAYVCDLDPETIKAYRGTATVREDGARETPAGTDSPFRNRTPEENLDLFRRMQAGEFPDGTKTLRAKIDMAHPNLNMRDPVMYRIQNAPHHRQGDAWRIYPMYDWAHGLEDSIEGITHSLCSLEYENHRPLYDWFLDRLGIYHPRQIEFARLNLSHTVLSKRRLIRLVREGHVDGWDDPRMPTLCGLRRRGCPPEAICEFCRRIGVAKTDSLVEMALLEHCIREELNRTAQRVMGVLDPLKVVIENYPEGEEETLGAVNNPEDPAAGVRQVPFGRELWIEREDFMEDPPRKFFRLAPGREVRLRYAYFITCTDVVKNDAGEVVELRCTYDPATRGGDAPDGRKVKGTLHWVSARHAVACAAHLYEPLFTTPRPGQGKEDFLEDLNPASRTVVDPCWAEPAVAALPAGARMQFERKGYFAVDPDTTDAKPVLHRIVTLKDSWKKQNPQAPSGAKKPGRRRRNRGG